MTVKMASRVIEIIELFAQEKQPLALSEMARLLEMPVSTCLGLIRTLEAHGYIYETGRRQGYYLTGRLLAMAQVIAAHDPVIDSVKPALMELRDNVRETVVLGKLREDWEVVYLEVLDGPQRIRYFAQAGETRHAYANSQGRALLSTLTLEARNAAFKEMKLQRLTETTLTTATAINAEIERSKVRGWFAILGETNPELAGIAWPVHFGRQTYAVSIAGPRNRIEPRIEELSTMLRATCATIERSGSTKEAP
jgi:IclR family acetate operon transcriptional repressor